MPGATARHVAVQVTCRDSGEAGMLVDEESSPEHAEHGLMSLVILDVLFRVRNC